MKSLSIQGEKMTKGEGLNVGCEEEKSQRRLWFLSLGNR